MSKSGVNNCATCRYSQYEHGDGHCYMFRNEPEGVCMQHTGHAQADADLAAALAAVLGDDVFDAMLKTRQP
jgi:hypothetical protein